MTIETIVNQVAIAWQVHGKSWAMQRARDVRYWAWKAGTKKPLRLIYDEFRVELKRGR